MVGEEMAFLTALEGRRGSNFHRNTEFQTKDAAKLKARSPNSVQLLGMVSR